MSRTSLRCSIIAFAFAANLLAHGLLGETDAALSVQVLPGTAESSAGNATLQPARGTDQINATTQLELPVAASNASAAAQADKPAQSQANPTAEQSTSTASTTTEDPGPTSASSDASATSTDKSAATMRQITEDTTTITAAPSTATAATSATTEVKKIAETVTLANKTPENPEKPDQGMSSGIIAIVMAIVFAIVVVIVYAGLLLWRRYLEYRYGNRELLVNDLEFDTNDLRHFEL